MYNFKNDYAEGAHPLILEQLFSSNLVQELGYGEDHYSKNAKEAIRGQINNPEAPIYFVSGGTQANLLVISHLLRPHEAVISAKTGHIYANETGAIEAIGHRIITVDSVNGKVTASDVAAVIAAHQLRPHVVKPKMLYISNSTELGTIYRKDELMALHAICRQHDLFLFLDGARLGHALTAKDNDLSLADIASYTDVFYIGGTKNGALLGEAIVFRTADLAEDFDYILKQKGALLAKGRILGIQFLTLFTDDLYFNLAKKANRCAQQIADRLIALGFSFLTPPQTNQLFPILPRKVIDQLLAKYAFYIWTEIDETHAAVRIITSWATDETLAANFCKDLEILSENERKR
ncbi:threonine aldolase family protein [Sphingobacterium griseoflavum]|uniref:Amino acid lyase n=1 Tax=Sphingobacterium griseoflavum TaxID=1474952 RepID=A0ABQ3HTM6_9SPHI|nr:aminotransferase class I/II-fold pyridoxal phosphate-dependent enzyme [Sphingobacterium griseoflavum]GHE33662.1 amino acid lyase [Sphingobacterium griseoflavum]